MKVALKPIILTLFTRWNKMTNPYAKWGIVAALILFVAIGASCGLFQSAMPVAPEKPVCQEPGFEDSWICAALQKSGIEHAETAMEILLDANDIALLMEAYTPEQILLITANVRTYLTMADNISYTMFLEYFIQETDKAKRLASIIERRFKIIRSPEIIRGSDMWLIFYALDALDAQAL